MHSLRSKSFCTAHSYNHHPYHTGFGKSMDVRSRHFQRTRTSVQSFFHLHFQRYSAQGSTVSTYILRSMQKWLTSNSRKPIPAQHEQFPHPRSRPPRPPTTRPHPRHPTRRNRTRALPLPRHCSYTWERSRSRCRHHLCVRCALYSVRRQVLHQGSFIQRTRRFEFI
jgi:hypothetical protein